MLIKSGRLNEECPEGDPDLTLEKWEASSKDEESKNEESSELPVGLDKNRLEFIKRLVLAGKVSDNCEFPPD